MKTLQNILMASAIGIGSMGISEVYAHEPTQKPVPENLRPIQKPIQRPLQKPIQKPYTEFSNLRHLTNTNVPNVLYQQYQPQAICVNPWLQQPVIHQYHHLIPNQPKVIHHFNVPRKRDFGRVESYHTTEGGLLIKKPALLSVPFRNVGEGLKRFGRNVERLVKPQWEYHPSGYLTNQSHSTNHCDGRFSDCMR
jgi:hypothetical protein